LQLDEVGRPLQYHVAGQVELFETGQFDERVGQHRQEVVADLESLEVLEFGDVLGDVGEVVTAEVQPLEPVSERQVDRQRRQSVVR